MLRGYFEAMSAGGRDVLGEVPDDFWPTYSAMANTQDGCIVLAVAEPAAGWLVAGTG